MTEAVPFSKPLTRAERVAEANRLIDVLGGGSKTAALLGLTRSRVSQMKTLGMPDHHMEVIFQKRPDLFQRPSAVLADERKQNKEPKSVLLPPEDETVVTKEHGFISLRLFAANGEQKEAIVWSIGRAKEIALAILSLMEKEGV